MIPSWLLRLGGAASPLGLAYHMSSLLDSEMARDTPESLAKRHSRGEVMRNAIRQGAAGGPEMAALAASQQKASGVFDPFSPVPGANSFMPMGAPVSPPAASFAQPAMPQMAQPSPLDTMDFPFGPSNIPGAPVPPAALEAMKAMQRPAAAPAAAQPVTPFDPSSIPGFNPNIPNMADPSLMSGKPVARPVSDGEGGFMNDFMPAPASGASLLRKLLGYA